MDKKFFPIKMSFYLKTHELNQNKLAIVLKCSKTTVNSWLTGKTIPSINLLFKLSEFCQKDFNWFFSDFTEEDKEEALELIMKGKR